MIHVDRVPGVRLVTDSDPPRKRKPCKHGLTHGCTQCGRQPLTRKDIR